MNDWYQQSSSVEIAIHHFWRRQKRHSFDTQIVRIVPVDQVEMAKAIGRCLIVKHIQAMGSRTRYNNDSNGFRYLEWRLAVMRVDCARYVPVEHEHIQTMG